MFSFILSDISRTPAFAQIAPTPVKIPASALDLKKIALPEELGSIQDSFFSGGKPGKFVFYLQGAHANYDSETNTRKLIEFFQKEYHLPLVLLEGGEGKLDSLFFKSFPDQTLKEKILDEYLKKGDLSGDEIASIGNDFDTKYYGIEEKNLYQENKSAFLKAIEKEKEVIQILDQIESKLNGKIDQLSEKAKEFLEKQHAFRNEEIDLLEYLELLTELSPLLKYPELSKLLGVKSNEKPIKSEEIDITVNRMIQTFQKNILPELPKPEQMELNQLIQMHRIGQLSEGMLVKRIQDLARKHNFFFDTPEVLKPGVKQAQTLSSIKGTKIFDELEMLEDELRNSLPESEEEKNLLGQFRELELLRNLARLELTPKDWEEIRNRKSFLIPVDSQLFQSHFRFYRLAEKRNDVLFENSLKIMNDEKASTALLSTGGFHAQRITDRLKAHGISYLLVSPNIHQIDDRSHYLKAMKDERSFMNYFRGSFWDALARDYSEKIVSSFPEMNRAELKLWRDRIIQNLVSEERVTEARQYTSYIDSLVSEPKTDQAVSDYFQKIENLIRKKLNIFGEGLKEIWSGDITPEAVSPILDRMNQVKIATLKESLMLIDDRTAMKGWTQPKIVLENPVSVEFVSEMKNAKQEKLNVNGGISGRDVENGIDPNKKQLKGQSPERLKLNLFLRSFFHPFLASLLEGYSKILPNARTITKLAKTILIIGLVAAKKLLANPAPTDRYSRLASIPAIKALFASPNIMLLAPVGYSTIVLLKVKLNINNNQLYFTVRSEAGRAKRSEARQLGTQPNQLRARQHTSVPVLAQTSERLDARAEARASDRQFRWRRVFNHLGVRVGAAAGLLDMITTAVGYWASGGNWASFKKDVLTLDYLYDVYGFYSDLFQLQYLSIGEFSLHEHGTGVRLLAGFLLAGIFYLVYDIGRGGKIARFLSPRLKQVVAGILLGPFAARLFEASAFGFTANWWTVHASNGTSITHLADLIWLIGVPAIPVGWVISLFLFPRFTKRNVAVLVHERDPDLRAGYIRMIKSLGFKDVTDVENGIQNGNAAGYIILTDDDHGFDRPVIDFAQDLPKGKPRIIIWNTTINHLIHLKRKLMKGESPEIDVLDDRLLEEDKVGSRIISAAREAENNQDTILVPDLLFQIGENDIEKILEEALERLNSNRSEARRDRERRSRGLGTPPNQRRAEARIDQQKIDLLKSERLPKLSKSYYFDLNEFVRTGQIRPLSSKSKKQVRKALNFGISQPIEMGEQGFVSKDNTVIIDTPCVTCTGLFVYNTRTKELFYAHSIGPDITNIEEVLEEAKVAFENDKEKTVIVLSGNNVGLHTPETPEDAEGLIKYMEGELEKREKLLRQAESTGFHVMRAYSDFVGVDINAYIDSETGIIKILQLYDKPLLVGTGIENKKYPQFIRDYIKSRSEARFQRKAGRSKVVKEMKKAFKIRSQKVFKNLEANERTLLRIGDALGGEATFDRGGYEISQTRLYGTNLIHFLLAHLNILEQKTQQGLLTTAAAWVLENQPKAVVEIDFIESLLKTPEALDNLKKLRALIKAGSTRAEARSDAHSLQLSAFAYDIRDHVIFEPITKGQQTWVNEILEKLRRQPMRGYVVRAGHDLHLYVRPIKRRFLRPMPKPYVDLHEDGRSPVLYLNLNSRQTVLETDVPALAEQIRWQLSFYQANEIEWESYLKAHDLFDDRIGLRLSEDLLLVNGPLYKAYSLILLLVSYGDRGRKILSKQVPISQNIRDHFSEKKMTGVYQPGTSEYSEPVRIIGQALAAGLSDAFDLLDQFISHPERQKIDELRQWSKKNPEGFLRNVTKLVAFKGMVIPGYIILDVQGLERVLRHERLHQFILDSPLRQSFQEAYIEFLKLQSAREILIQLIANTSYAAEFNLKREKFFDEIFVQSQYPSQAIETKPHFASFVRLLRESPATQNVMSELEELRRQSGKEAEADLALIHANRDRIAQAFYSEARQAQKQITIRAEARQRDRRTADSVERIEDPINSLTANRHTLNANRRSEARQAINRRMFFGLTAVVGIGLVFPEFIKAETKAEGDEFLTLLEDLKSNDEVRILNALKMLSKQNRKVALELLKPHLISQNKEIRKYAFRVIRHGKIPVTLDFLESLLKSDHEGNLGLGVKAELADRAISFAQANGHEFTISGLKAFLSDFDTDKTRISDLTMSEIAKMSHDLGPGFERLFYEEIYKRIKTEYEKRNQKIPEDLAEIEGPLLFLFESYASSGLWDRYSAEEQLEKLYKAADFILRKRDEILDQVLVGGEQIVLLLVHDDRDVTVRRERIEFFKPKEVMVFHGSKDKKAYLRTLRRLSASGEQFMSYFSGHGEKAHSFLSKGEMGSENSDRAQLPNAIHYGEEAGALMDGEALSIKLQESQSEPQWLTFWKGACYQRDFLANMISEVDLLAEEKEVKTPKIIGISSGDEGRITYLDKFPEAIEALNIPKGEPLRVRHVLEAIRRLNKERPHQEEKPQVPNVIIFADEKEVIEALDLPKDFSIKPFFQIGQNKLDSAQLISMRSEARNEINARPPTPISDGEILAALEARINYYSDPSMKVEFRPQDIEALRPLFILGRDVWDLDPNNTADKINGSFRSHSSGPWHSDTETGRFREWLEKESSDYIAFWDFDGWTERMGDALRQGFRNYSKVDSDKLVTATDGLGHLLVNAYDAVLAREYEQEEAGTKADDQKRIHFQVSLSPAGVLTAVIEDNGTGIPLEDLKKLFDGSFSTKPPVISGKNRRGLKGGIGEGLWNFASFLSAFSEETQIIVETKFGASAYSKTYSPVSKKSEIKPIEKEDQGTRIEVQIPLNELEKRPEKTTNLIEAAWPDSVSFVRSEARTDRQGQIEQIENTRRRTIQILELVKDLVGNKREIVERVINDLDTEEIDAAKLKEAKRIIEIITKKFKAAGARSVQGLTQISADLDQAIQWLEAKPDQTGSNPIRPFLSSEDPNLYLDYAESRLRELKSLRIDQAFIAKVWEQLSAKIYPPLSASLHKNTSEDRKLKALQALPRLSPSIFPKMIERLIEISEKDASQKVRQAANQTLGKLIDQVKDNEHAVSLLLPVYLSNFQRTYQTEALMRILSQLGRKDIQAILEDRSIFRSRPLIENEADRSKRIAAVKQFTERVLKSRDMGLIPYGHWELLRQQREENRMGHPQVRKVIHESLQAIRGFHRSEVRQEKIQQFDLTNSDWIKQVSSKKLILYSDIQNRRANQIYRRFGFKQLDHVFPSPKTDLHAYGFINDAQTLLEKTRARSEVRLPRFLVSDQRVDWGMFGLSIGFAFANIIHNWISWHQDPLAFYLGFIGIAAASVIYFSKIKPIRDKFYRLIEAKEKRIDEAFDRLSRLKDDAAKFLLFQESEDVFPSGLIAPFLDYLYELKRLDEMELFGLRTTLYPDAVPLTPEKLKRYLSQRKSIDDLRPKMLESLNLLKEKLKRNGDSLPLDGRLNFDFINEMQKHLKLIPANIIRLESYLASEPAWPPFDMKQIAKRAEDEPASDVYLLRESKYSKDAMAIVDPRRDLEVWIRLVPSDHPVHLNIRLNKKLNVLPRSKFDERRKKAQASGKDQIPYEPRKRRQVSAPFVFHSLMPGNELVIGNSVKDINNIRIRIVSVGSHDVELLVKTKRDVEVRLPVVQRSEARMRTNPRAEARNQESAKGILPLEFEYQIVDPNSVMGRLNLPSEYRNRLVKDKSNRLFIVKNRHPVSDTNYLWRVKNDPVREYIAFRLGRELQANTSDIVIPKAKDRKVIAKALGLQPYTIYLSRLTIDYDRKNPEVIKKHIKRAFTRNFVVFAILMRKYDFHDSNRGNLRNSSLKYMEFDNDQLFHPRVEDMRRFVDAFMLNFYTLPYRSMRINPNEFLENLDLKELAQAVHDIENFDLENFKKVIKHELSNLYSSEDIQLNDYFDFLTERKRIIRDETVDFFYKFLLSFEGAVFTFGLIKFTQQPKFTVNEIFYILDRSEARSHLFKGGLAAGVLAIAFWNFSGDRQSKVYGSDPATPAAESEPEKLSVTREFILSRLDPANAQAVKELLAIATDQKIVLTEEDLRPLRDADGPDKRLIYRSLISYIYFQGIKVSFEFLEPLVTSNAGMRGRKAALADRAISFAQANGSQITIPELKAHLDRFTTQKTSISDLSVSEMAKMSNDLGPGFERLFYKEISDRLKAEYQRRGEEVPPELSQILAPLLFLFEYYEPSGLWDQYSELEQLEKMYLAADLILKKRHEGLDEIVVGKDRAVVVAVHKGRSAKTQEDKMKRFGAVDVKVFGGNEDVNDLKKTKEDFLEALGELSASRKPSTVWFSGHGGLNHFWFADGEIGRERSDYLYDPAGVSYVEEAKALLDAQKDRDQVELGHMKFMQGGCFQCDMVQKMKTELEIQAKARGLRIKSYPEEIDTSGGEGRITYSDKLWNAIEAQKIPEGMPLTRGHILEADMRLNTENPVMEHEYQDPAVFISIDPEEFREALGLPKDVPADPFLRISKGNERDSTLLVATRSEARNSEDNEKQEMEAIEKSQYASFLRERAAKTVRIGMELKRKGQEPFDRVLIQEFFSGLERSAPSKDYPKILDVLRILFGSSDLGVESLPDDPISKLLSLAARSIANPSGESAEIDQTALIVSRRALLKFLGMASINFSVSGMSSFGEFATVISKEVSDQLFIQKNWYYVKGYLTGGLFQTVVNEIAGYSHWFPDLFAPRKAEFLVALAESQARHARVFKHLVKSKRREFDVAFSHFAKHEAGTLRPLIEQFLKVFTEPISDEDWDEAFEELQRRRPASLLNFLRQHAHEILAFEQKLGRFYPSTIRFLENKLEADPTSNFQELDEDLYRFYTESLQELTRKLNETREKLDRIESIYRKVWKSEGFRQVSQHERELLNQEEELREIQPQLEEDIRAVQDLVKDLGISRSILSHETFEHLSRSEARNEIVGEETDTASEIRRLYADAAQGDLTAFDRLVEKLHAEFLLSDRSYAKLMILIEYIAELLHYFNVHENLEKDSLFKKKVVNRLIKYYRIKKLMERSQVSKARMDRAIQDWLDGNDSYRDSRSRLATQIYDGLSGRIMEGDEAVHYREFYDLLRDEHPSRSVDELVAPVAAAFFNTPRHLYALPFPSREEKFYQDVPISSERGQTISQPSLMAFILSILNLKGDEKVMEVGAGSGWFAAWMSLLVGQVDAIERIPSLVSQARINIDKTRRADKVSIFKGDGWEGLPERAPYDVIVVSAMLRVMPELLLDQLLSNNGRMIAPINDQLKLFVKNGPVVIEKDLVSVKYVDLVKGSWGTFEAEIDLASELLVRGNDLADQAPRSEARNDDVRYSFPESVEEQEAEEREIEAVADELTRRVQPIIFSEVESVKLAKPSIVEKRRQIQKENPKVISSKYRKRSKPFLRQRPKSFYPGDEVFKALLVKHQAKLKPMADELKSSEPVISLWIGMHGFMELAQKLRSTRIDEKLGPPSHYPGDDAFKALLIKYQAKPGPIAQELGVGYGTVSSWISQHGFKNFARELRTLYPGDEVLEALLLKYKGRQNPIGRELGFSSMTISKWVRQHGFADFAKTLRAQARSEARGLPSLRGNVPSGAEAISNSGIASSATPPRNDDRMRAEARDKSSINQTLRRDYLELIAQLKKIGPINQKMADLFKFAGKLDIDLAVHEYLNFVSRYADGKYKDTDPVSLYGNEHWLNDVFRNAMQELENSIDLLEKTDDPDKVYQKIYLHGRAAYAIFYLGQQIDAENETEIKQTFVKIKSAHSEAREEKFRVINDDIQLNVVSVSEAPAAFAEAVIKARDRRLKPEDDVAVVMSLMDAPQGSVQFVASRGRGTIQQITPVNAGTTGEVLYRESIGHKMLVHTVKLEPDDPDFKRSSVRIRTKFDEKGRPNRLTIVPYDTESIRDPQQSLRNEDNILKAVGHVIYPAFASFYEKDGKLEDKVSLDQIPVFGFEPPYVSTWDEAFFVRKFWTPKRVSYGDYEAPLIGIVKLSEDRDRLHVVRDGDDFTLSFKGIHDLDMVQSASFAVIRYLKQFLRLNQSEERFQVTNYYWDPKKWNPIKKIVPEKTVQMTDLAVITYMPDELVRKNAEHIRDVHVDEASDKISVRLTIQKKGDLFRMHYRDNGQGFDPHTYVGSEGLKERIIEAQSNHGVGLAMYNIIHEFFERNRIGKLTIRSRRSVHVENGEVRKSDEKFRGAEFVMEIRLKEENGTVFIDSVQVLSPEEIAARSEARYRPTDRPQSFSRSARKPVKKSLSPKRGLPKTEVLPNKDSKPSLHTFNRIYKRFHHAPFTLRQYRRHYFDRDIATIKPHLRKLKKIGILEMSRKNEEGGEQDDFLFRLKDFDPERLAKIQFVLSEYVIDDDRRIISKQIQRLLQRRKRKIFRLPTRKENFSSRKDAYLRVTFNFLWRHFRGEWVKSENLLDYLQGISPGAFDNQVDLLEELGLLQKSRKKGWKKTIWIRVLKLKWYQAREVSKALTDYSRHRNKVRAKAEIAYILKSQSPEAIPFIPFDKSDIEKPLFHEQPSVFPGKISFSLRDLIMAVQAESKKDPFGKPIRKRVAKRLGISPGELSTFARKHRVTLWRLGFRSMKFPDDRQGLEPIIDQALQNLRRDQERFGFDLINPAPLLESDLAYELGYKTLPEMIRNINSARIKLRDEKVYSEDTFPWKKMPHYRVWRDELKARRNRNLNEYLQELIDQAVGDFQASMESGEDKKLLQTRVQIFDPGHPVLKRYEILRKKRAEDKVSTKKKLINKLEKEKSYGRRLRLAKNYLKSLPFVDEINDPFELASWARIPVTLLLHQSQQIWLSTFPDVRSNKGLHERFLDLIIKTTHALNQLWMAENGDETNDEEINKNTVLYYTEKAEALIHQLNELKLVAAEENRKDIDLAIRMMRETFRYIQEPSKNGEKEPLNEKHLEVLRLLKEDKYKAILRLDQIKLNPEINQLIRTRSRSETREHELDYETESLPQEVLSGLPQLSVGSRIRTIRLARGHRVTDVSKGSGVLLNTYTSAEKESRKGLPTPKNLIKLAKFFKVDPMLIIFGLSYEETIKAYQEEKISDYQLFDGLMRRKGLIEKELAEELEKARLQMGRKDSKSKHSHVDLWAKRVIPHPDKWPIIRKVLGEGKLYTSQEAQKRAQYIIGRTWATLRDELSNKRVSISRRANDTLISQPIDLQISETTKMDDAELKRRASQEEDGIMTLLQNLEKVLGDPTKQKMVNSALFQIPERKIRDAKFLTPQKRQELQALLDTLRDVSPKPVSNESELAQDIAKAKEILRQNSIQFPHLPAESFLVDSMRRFLLTLTTEPLNEDLLYKNTQEFLNDKAKVAKATTKSSGITDLTRKVQKIAEDVSKILISRSEAREKLKVIGGDDGVFARNQLGGEPLQREVGKRSSRIATTYPLPRSDLNSSVPPLRFNPKNSTNDQARQESAYVGPLFLGQHGSKLPENYLKVNRKLINNEILTKLSRAFSARDLVNGARNREIAPQVIAEALRRLKLNGFTKDQIDELVEWLTAQKIREFYAFEKILYTGIKGTVQINLNDDLSELQEFLRTSLALLILNPDLVIEINHSGNIKQKFAKMLADIQNTEYVGKPVSTTRLRYNSVFDSNADVIFDHDFFLDGASVPAGTADEAILAAVSKLKRRIEDAPSGIRRISEGRYGWESPASIQPFSPQTTVVITQAQAQFREFARAA